MNDIFSNTIVDYSEKEMSKLVSKTGTLAILPMQSNVRASELEHPWMQDPLYTSQ